MRNIPWTSKEIDFLYNNYYEKSKSYLCDSLHIRSWDAIKLKANSLGLRKKPITKSNIEILLENKNESFYWMGFLLADGSFSKKRISFSIKDIHHQNIFRDYINYTGKNKECIAPQDKEIVPLIIKKFNINLNKTYNPPNITLNNFSENLSLSLIYGFIDGDGCISYQTNRKDPKLRIQLHESWLYFLEQVSSFFKRKFGSFNIATKLNSKGYSQLVITHSFLLKKIKLKLLELNIPFLKRKWNRIDHNKKTPYEIKRNKNIKRINSILKHKKQSGNKNWIYKVCEELDEKYGTIYGFCKKGGYLL